MLADKKITQFDFGLFLSKTIGKIGDRHSFIKDYDIRDSLYLTLAFAPFKGKVLVVDFQRDIKEYKFWNSEFPYLQSINNIPIQEILPKIHIGEILAPKDAYATNAVRDLRDIETIFRTLKIELPNPLPITLSDDKGNKKEISVKLVDGKNRATLWDDRFFKNTYRVKEEEV